MRAAAEPTGLRVGWAGALLSLLWAVLLHHGVGPRFRGDLWLEPSSFLLGAAPDTLLPALAVLALPCLALAVAVSFVTSAVLPRLLAGFATLASVCFVFYGIEADRVWRFFHWRGSVTLVLFAGVVALALYAPSLAARWRQLGWPLRLATYLPVFAFVMGYERNVTGTNPELPFALSPWPVVQIIGLELVASSLAALQLGVALGLAGLVRGRGLRALGLLATAALPVASLALGSASGLLPFQAGPRLYAFTAAVCFAVLAGCALWPPRSREAWARRASNLALGGLLAALPLIAGQALTRLDYSVTRDDHAQRIIDALATHRAVTGTYPDALSELVEAGRLDDVPRPRIGFLRREAFVYQNFGESYLLEFSAPRWIQCAYNPPWLPAPGEDVDEFEEEELSGAWSCPQKPPELW